MTIEQFLEKLSRHVDHKYGKMLRSRFKDLAGSSELAMLASPSRDELEQLKKAVAIMTPAEKADVRNLSDDQVRKIAEDAKTDPAILAIFINGYVLHCKRVS